MSKIIATINSKGGVGKTTSCVALAEYFAAELGLKVLVIDLDWQTNATNMLMHAVSWEKKQKEERTLAHFLSRRILEDKYNENLQSYVIPRRSNIHTIDNGRQTAPPLSLVPGSPDMDDLDFKIIRKLFDDDFDQIIDRLSSFMKQELASLGTTYKYIFVDCPPKMDIFTKAIIKIADFAVVPYSHQRLSLYGLGRFIDRMAQLRQQERSRLPYGTLPTRVKNLKSVDSIIDEVRNAFKSVDARIPETEHIAKNGEFEFSDEGRGRITWRAKWGTKGSQGYEAAAEDILRRI